MKFRTSFDLGRSTVPLYSSIINLVVLIGLFLGARKYPFARQALYIES